MEQEERLKANIFSKYEDVMELFEDYLNYYDLNINSKKNNIYLIYFFSFYR